MPGEQTQVTTRFLADQAITRAKLNVSVAGQAVIARVLEVVNSGIKINGSTGVDTGTGDVGLALDWTLLDARWVGVNDSRLTNARPASDVSAWAKASVKPTYTYGEVGAAPASTVSFPGFGTSHVLAAYGDHAHAGVYQPVGSYLTSFTETDPVFTAWNKSTGISITKSQVSDFPTALSAFSNDLGNYGSFVTGTPWTAVGYGLASDLTTHAGLTTTAHGLGASAFHADSYFQTALTGLTANYHTKWNGSTLVNSIGSDDGTTFNVTSGGVASYFQSGYGGYSSLTFSGDSGATKGSFSTWGGVIYIGSENGSHSGSNGEIRINPYGGAVLTLNSDRTANFASNLTANTFIKSGGTSAEYLLADGSVTTTAGSVYKGELNASTGVPVAGGSALANGTGTPGWYYACGIGLGGSHDYGSGSIPLADAQQLYYNGTVWMRLPAALAYTLPIATSTALGGVKSNGNVSVNALTGGMTVETNANLTGVITSVGNTTSIASQTGTGTTFVVSIRPSILGTNAAESGASVPNGSLLLTDQFGDGRQVITMGVVNGGGNHSWIQSRNSSTTSVYELKLNPSGGLVSTGGAFTAGGIVSATGGTSTDWNAKQAALNGTGFVKISGTTVSYDNSTYLTTAGSAANLTSFPILNQNTTGSAGSVAWTGVSGRPTLLSQFTNDLGNYGGYVTGTPWTGYGYVTGTPWTGYGYVTGTPWTAMGYLTGITSLQVTTALGFTPYNSSNPSGYITSSALSGYWYSGSHPTTIAGYGISDAPTPFPGFGTSHSLAAYGDHTHSGYGSGDVVGPASATSSCVALFDGTTGKLLKNSSLVYDNNYSEISAGALYLNGSGAHGSTITVVGGGSFSSSVSASNYITTSDRRRKTEIEDYIPEFLSVSYRSFFMKDDLTRRRAGVIHDELKLIAPELTYTDIEGYGQVAYIDLCVREIAWLKHKISPMDELVQKVADLEEEVSQLKTELKRA